MKQSKPSWQGRSTLLGIGFTVVTIAYIGYRLLVAGGYSGASALVIRPPEAVDIGCASQQKMGSTANSLPSVSPAYQQFIDKQQAVTGNLIVNADLLQVDAKSGEPRGFYRTFENKSVRYQALAGKQRSERFLRVINTAKTAAEEKGTWVSDLISMDKDASYSYSFEYRGDTPVEVTIEYLATKTSHAYETVAVLNKNSGWQRFTGYTANHRDALAFRFVVAPVDAGQLDLRGFSVKQLVGSSAGSGLVTLTFDDGWQSIADHAIPLLDAKGFKTTQFVISEAAEKKVDDYMNMHTLQQLQKEGHEIGSHSALHCDQTTLPIPAAASDAAKSRGTLQRHKLGPVNAFAYPYGAHSPATQEVYAKHYDLIRTSDEGYNDAYFDQQNIRTFAVLNTTPPELIQSWLDHAARHKLWIVLVYHRVDNHGTYSITSEQFARQLQLIQKSGLPVLTLSEAANKIRP
jgi:peptidoglycan/xylan/chitin deacetylase (PgdA/CDA1 family)